MDPGVTIGDGNKNPVETRERPFDGGKGKFHARGGLKLEKKRVKLNALWGRHKVEEKGTG